MANAGTGASPQPRAASCFFVDSKKGEVNELKALLKNINVERDMKRKRDVLKKVKECKTWSFAAFGVLICVIVGAV